MSTVQDYMVLKDIYQRVYRVTHNEKIAEALKNCEQKIKELSR